MDLDAYSDAHRAEWAELARLASARNLSGAESDELIDRYQTGASQLSTLQSVAGSTVQSDRLSLTLSRARLKFTGASTNILRQIPRFVAFQLPAALYRIRWLTIWIAVAFAVVGTLVGLWAFNTPGVLTAAFGSNQELKKMAEEDFVGYYSENGMDTFTAMVWTNNAWVAAQCIAFGIVGVFVPVVLFSNAMNVGLAGAAMASYNHLDLFFLYISPHGQLELYSIFLAGAAGLRVFWAWIAPGARTRAQALAEDGRAMFTVAIGLVFALFVSGVIEGFVTRQDWPWVIKIGIGTIALAAMLAYQWILGGIAYRAGQTGDLEAFEAGARKIVAA